VRPLYEAHGAQGYYEQHGADYRNPHEAVVRACLQDALLRWNANTAHVLDLACGSGEVTLCLREAGVASITGVDPYTATAYRARTGQDALPHSFEAIADGVLEGQAFSLIICSFALHLAPASRLPTLCYQLARLAPMLWVLTPHKRPHIAPEWGWRLQEETLIQRVRTRCYTRLN
jgi:SAM-dependent methyltransferase